MNGKVALALVVVVSVGGGLAWMVRAGVRQDAAGQFSMARFTYDLKVNTERIHNASVEALIRLGKRKASVQPTDEDMQFYREARDAERAFVEACKRCASAAECEQARQSIAAQRSSDTYNPCE